MKSVAVIIILLMLFVSGNSVSGHTTNKASGINQFDASVPAIPITITNYGNQSTGNFTYDLVVDSLQYGTYINANWSNVEFTSEIGYPLNAWIEDNATNTSSNTSIWIRLPNIQSHGSIKIFMVFLSKRDYMLSKSGHLCTGN